MTLKKSTRNKNKKQVNLNSVHTCLFSWASWTTELLRAAVFQYFNVLAIAALEWEMP